LTMSFATGNPPTTRPQSEPSSQLYECEIYGKEETCGVKKHQVVFYTRFGHETSPGLTMSFATGNPPTTRPQSEPSSQLYECEIYGKEERGGGERENHQKTTCPVGDWLLGQPLAYVGSLTPAPCS
jgi:hypothetical protein